MRRRGPARAPALACLLAALLGGCARDRREPPAAQPPAGPIGGAAYWETLRARGGLDLAPLELAARAAEDAAWLSERMDALAARLPAGSGPERGWRAAFEPLRNDHPADADGVLAAYRSEVGRARAFVEDRGLVTIPDGPLEIVRTPKVFPRGRYTFAGYIGYRLAVTIHEGGDGGRLRDHCRVCIAPIVAHETFPGHHVVFLHQRSGTPVGDPEAIRRGGENLTNPFFHEAWGQYAEILMLENGYFAGDPAARLAALRSLLFRIERARIDPLLHLGEMTPDGAVAALSPFLDPATAREEVARHFADPGAKAAYYVGLLQILELRAILSHGDPDFDLRAFHDRLIRLPMPIPELARRRFGVELGAEPPRLEDALAGIIRP